MYSRPSSVWISTKLSESGSSEAEELEGEAEADTARAAAEVAEFFLLSWSISAIALTPGNATVQGTERMKIALGDLETETETEEDGERENEENLADAAVKSLEEEEEGETVVERINMGKLQLKFLRKGV